MRCTSCKEGDLQPTFIEGLFRAHHCSSCEGDLIYMNDYLAWKGRNPEYTFNDNATLEFDDLQDTKTAMICPESGAIMQKYKLTSKNTHRLDYSPISESVWLDKHEWELLKQEGLAGSLDSVVSYAWQQNIRKEGTESTFSDLYKKKFGEQDYEKIKLFKEWLNEHPNKADLIAYLMAKNPYSVNE